MTGFGIYKMGEIVFGRLWMYYSSQFMSASPGDVIYTISCFHKSPCDVSRRALPPQAYRHDLKHKCIYEL